MSAVICEFQIVSLACIITLISRQSKDFERICSNREEFSTENQQLSIKEMKQSNLGTP
jgi:hypothetical protein